MTLPRRIKQPKLRQSDRIRCPGHLQFVRSRACCVPQCLALKVDAAHVRSSGDGGVGLKPGDDWTISLCRYHHQEQHQVGEQAFEIRHGIDMKKLALEFASKSPALKRYHAKQRRAA